jgi:NAD(P)-dependent dehydrogenase (short-subunit alcohol dehydrogenase family)
MKRTAVVTGASRGIGAAIARRLHGDGFNVAFTWRQGADRAQALCDELPGAFALQADSADPSSPERVVTEVLDRFGRLDVVVGNAGVFPYGPIEEMTLDQIDEALAVHARAPYLLARAAAPHLPAGGRIISIGSCLAKRTPAAGLSLYAMSKSALAGMTHGLARDLGPRSITVNLVHPGSTDTDMNPADGEGADGERALSALGRYAEPEEIASVVAFLAGPDSAFVTGASWTVDGGYSA